MLLPIEDYDHSNVVEYHYGRFPPGDEDLDLARLIRPLVRAQDAIFATPVFTNSQLRRQSGMPRHVAGRITRLLHDGGLLQEVRPARGRRGALYMFDPLMTLVRA